MPDGHRTVDVRAELDRPDCAERHGRPLPRQRVLRRLPTLGNDLVVTAPDKHHQGNCNCDRTPRTVHETIPWIAVWVIAVNACWSVAF
ncbi:hypothetical protein GCM10009798_03590 [Nocardioides panacihumi]|uniref:Uncharacterized protein n=1 Tax=Nocardioides panacihumi TaxID=400774 RepID=A0ABN2Q9J6_9ACTN